VTGSQRGASVEPWMVMRASRDRGWGGDIRRARIFERLAELQSARVVDDWPTFQRAIRGRRWQAWLPGRRPRPHLAASETAPPRWVERIVALSDPVAVAIYDDSVAQARALGLDLSPERAADLALRRRVNEAAFRWHVVPTASFADLVGLDPARIIVGGNGTVASHVLPGPWPDVPAVGFVSGAAPGRGIEILLEAVRQVRAVVHGTRLLLWLIATGPDGEAYIDGLRAATATDDWVEIGTAPYERLGPSLARATVLAIPHPANDYMDVALPVKLFDSMAAGRPLVVTPRPETAAIVERGGVGLVAADDDPASIAAACVRLLEDAALARRMGEAARALAVREYDWPIVGDRIAAEILRREGLTG
jgi:glycosyltransferase involved in cell wall biosynthesis